MIVRASECSRRWEVDLLCTIKSDQKGSDMIKNSWHPLKKLREAYFLQVAEFAKLKVAEFAELRGTQLSNKCLHNLLNTKPLYFSGKGAIIWFVEQNPSREMIWILNNIGVVKIVIDRIGVTIPYECYEAKQKLELWLEMIFSEIQQELSLVTTVQRCSLGW